MNDPSIRLGTPKIWARTVEVGRIRIVNNFFDVRGEIGM